MALRSPHAAEALLTQEQLQQELIELCRELAPGAQVVGTREFWKTYGVTDQTSLNSVEQVLGDLLVLTRDGRLTGIEVVTNVGSRPRFSLGEGKISRSTAQWFCFVRSSDDVCVVSRNAVMGSLHDEPWHDPWSEDGERYKLFTPENAERFPNIRQFVVRVINPPN